MIFSNKEQEIINILLNSKTMITAEQISELTNLSIKTIYRRIKKINSQSSSGREIILSERGKGLSINNEEYQLTIHMEEKNNEYPSRQLEIIFNLLLNSPRSIQLDLLYQHQYVSDDTIRLDLQKIREYIDPYKLKLSKKKDSVKIIGCEESVRKLLSEIINKKKILLNRSYLSKNNKVSYDDVDFITQQLMIIENRLSTQISYPYNENIFVHIYVMMSRYKNANDLNEISADEELIDKKIITENKDLFILSQEIVTNIEQYLGTTLNDEEIYFLFQYLYSSRLVDKLASSEKENKNIQIAENLTKSVLDNFSLNVSMTDLAREIFPHLEMMIYRIKQKINISNELLIDIKREYKKLFDFLHEDMKRIIPDYDIPEDEIGFLTLYFAKYMEQVSEKIKILVICSTGVGTSELLKVKIKKSIPEVEIVEALSVNQFTKSISLERFKDIDLIVSTIKMNETYGIPCILVNAIFTESDKKTLRKRLEELQC